MRGTTTGNCGTLSRSLQRRLRGADPHFRRIHMVREVAVHYGRRRAMQAPMRGAEAIAAFFRSVIGNDAREHFLAVYLDSRDCAIGWQTVSTGSATAAIVHPREVFQPAVLLGAVALVVGHNHPSGDPSPPREDVEFTHRLVEAGETLGISVLDHVVWAEGRCVSLRERGEIRRAMQPRVVRRCAPVSSWWSQHSAW